MTARAIGADRFLLAVMTIKTRSVTARKSFEITGRRVDFFRVRGRDQAGFERDETRLARRRIISFSFRRSVADRAVVVFGFFIVSRKYEFRADKMRGNRAVSQRRIF